MGLANLLKKGIEEENWSLIIEAYEELTGDSFFTKNPVKVEEPKVERQEPDYIVPIRGKDYKPKRNISTDPNTGEEKNYGIRTPVDVKKIQAVGNLWNPNEYSDVEKDKDLKIVYPKKVKHKKRPPPTMVDVVCKECGDEHRIHAIYDRESGYMCDKCIKNRIPKR